MRSFDGGEQKREHSSSVRSGVCVVRGGDIRGTHARAAHSCDRPHRLKRCGVTMVSRIATSVWRAQSRVRAALACEANRARVRARMCGDGTCRVRCSDLCSFPLGVPVLTREFHPAPPKSDAFGCASSCPSRVSRLPRSLPRVRFKLDRHAPKRHCDQCKLSTPSPWRIACRRLLSRSPRLYTSASQ